MVIHNPILTGSFTVNNIDVSSITSSAANITALNATTASLNSFSASVLSYTSSLNNKTSSFATTGSNTFIGTQTITGSVLQSGSFTSTGTITAQTLVVQTVTSSIVYSSGSNIFGNSLANTQVLTGSLGITGSSHTIFGNVGIGTSSPGANFDVKSSNSGQATAIFQNSSDVAGLNINTHRSKGTIAIPTAVTTGQDLLRLNVKGYGVTNYFNAALIEVAAESNFSDTSSPGRITFSTTQTSSTSLVERMRITNYGNILINTTTDAGFKLDVSGSTRITNNLTVSGSTLLTGSLTLIGNEIITGSLTVITGSGVEFQVTNTGVKIGNAITDVHTVTGSLSISGSTTATSFTGSLSGTASYANNADLLDGLDSTVFATTGSVSAFTASINAFSASVLTFTGSASTRLGALESYTSSLNNKTSSFATTGSNIFIGTQTITGSVLQSGSFTSTGTLTAQTLVVQTITSSVVYSSGSNVFGNSIGNSQVFTGSMFITGSNMTANVGTACFGGMSIINSCLGIGTTPGGIFDVKTGACSNILFTGDYADVSAINSYSTTNGFQTLKYAAGIHTFYAGAMGSGSRSEAMRITSCGTTIVGYSKAGTCDNISRTLTLGGRPDIPHLVSLGFDSGCAYRADLDFSGTTGKFEFYNYNAGWSATPRLSIDINGISCFACQMCVPQLTVSNAGGASYNISNYLNTNSTTNSQTYFFIGQSLASGRSGFMDWVDNTDCSNGYIAFGVYGDNPASGTGAGLMIKKGACVGINNNNPLRHLHIGAGSDTPINPNNGLYVTNNGTTPIILRDSTNDVEYTSQVSSTGAIIGTLTNHDLIIYTCNAERMRIANNGVTALCINSALVMAKGTVAQRPTATSGMLRYNSDYNLMEFYNGTSWVQMGSGDLSPAQCINNTTMCHSVYQASGTLGLQGQGSGCISLYGAAAPSMAISNTGNQFATHGGHCGASDYPGYWAVHLGGARAANQLKVWIHANSWGYFELQGSNNSGNASGFNQSGNWTTLSFLCSNNSNCQNMGGNASGCTDGTVFSFWYTNDVPFAAYRIKVLDSSKQMCPLGNVYGGSAGYVWQLNRV